MITSGTDSSLKVWDLRTYKEMHRYFTKRPATTLDISHTGRLAMGWGANTEIWHDITTTPRIVQPYYLHHTFPGSTVSSLQFCPYEDVLGVGYSDGFQSLLVPGAGEPNYDAMEANPYENKKQRRENEVHMLLDKLQPDMITLDANLVGTVDRAPTSVLMQERKQAEQVAQTESKSSRRRKRKRTANIIQAAPIKNSHSMRKQLQQQAEKKQHESTGDALERFG